jgi:cephalosporin hydroxylase
MTTGIIPEWLLKSMERGNERYTYRGLRMWKSPIDMALYTRLIGQLQPRTIIEIGSFEGGSALWLHDQMEAQVGGGAVYSVDIEPVFPPSALRWVQFVRGDGKNLGECLPSTMQYDIKRPLLVIEDADHQPETTMAVLRFFDGWLRPGEYIVVEDGNIPEVHIENVYNGGPLVAIHEFLKERGEDYIIDREYTDFYGSPNCTFFPDGYLKRIK